MPTVELKSTVIFGIYLNIFYQIFGYSLIYMCSINRSIIMNRSSCCVCLEYALLHT